MRRIDRSTISGTAVQLLCLQLFYGQPPLGEGAFSALDQYRRTTATTLPMISAQVPSMGS